jgi:hypothetical protein
MSIKLQHQTIYDAKLMKLIEKGKILSEHRLHEEALDREGKYFGYDNDPQHQLDMALNPYQHNELNYELLKWMTQCHHVVSQILLLDSSEAYSKLFNLLSRKDAKVLKLAGHEVQEITICLDALLEDMKDGLFDNIFLKLEVQSIIDHLGQAQELFDEAQYGIASLIGLCALEGFLKRIAKELLLSQENNMDGHDDLCESEVKSNKSKTKKMKGEFSGMTNVANYLKGARILPKKASDKIKEWAEIRNELAHNNLEILDKEEARNLLIEIKALVTSIA